MPCPTPPASTSLSDPKYPQSNTAPTPKLPSQRKPRQALKSRRRGKAQRDDDSEDEYVAGAGYGSHPSSDDALSDPPSDSDASHQLTTTEDEDEPEDEQDIPVPISDPTRSKPQPTAPVPHLAWSDSKPTDQLPVIEFDSFVSGSTDALDSNTQKIVKRNQKSRAPPVQQTSSITSSPDSEPLEPGQAQRQEASNADDSFDARRAAKRARLKERRKEKRRIEKERRRAQAGAQPSNHPAVSSNPSEKLPQISTQQDPSTPSASNQNLQPNTTAKVDGHLSLRPSSSIPHDAPPAPPARGPGPRPPSPRTAYVTRLNEDPSYVPRIGKFWQHDPRLLGEDLRSMSSWWRARGGGRGGARRGGFRGGSFRGRGGFDLSFGNHNQSSRPRSPDASPNPNQPSPPSVGSTEQMPRTNLSRDEDIMSKPWAHDMYQEEEDDHAPAWNNRWRWSNRGRGGFTRATGQPLHRGVHRYAPPSQRGRPAFWKNGGHSTPSDATFRPSFRSDRFDNSGDHFRPPQFPQPFAKRNNNAFGRAPEAPWTVQSSVPFLFNSRHSRTFVVDRALGDFDDDLADTPRETNQTRGPPTKGTKIVLGKVRLAGRSKAPEKFEGWKFRYEIPPDHQTGSSPTDENAPAPESGLNQPVSVRLPGTSLVQKVTIYPPEWEEEEGEDEAAAAAEEDAKRETELLIQKERLNAARLQLEHRRQTAAEQNKSPDIPKQPSPDNRPSYPNFPETRQADPSGLSRQAPAFLPTRKSTPTEPNQPEFTTFPEAPLTSYPPAQPVSPPIFYAPEPQFRHPSNQVAEPTSIGPPYFPQQVFMGPAPSPPIPSHFSPYPYPPMYFPAPPPPQSQPPHFLPYTPPYGPPPGSFDPSMMYQTPPRYPPMEPMPMTPSPPEFFVPRSSDKKILEIRKPTSQSSISPKSPRSHQRQLAIADPSILFAQNSSYSS